MTDRKKKPLLNVGDPEILSIVLADMSRRMRRMERSIRELRSTLKERDAPVEATPPTNDLERVLSAAAAGDDRFVEGEVLGMEDVEDPISLTAEEQELEAAFADFKCEIESQLQSEDFDTHYNLGIAYKEMGLLDESIGELHLASKDPTRVVSTASMLGACFMEKGLPKLAVAWLQKGLDTPGVTLEERVELLYDQALAYEELGDRLSTRSTYVVILEISPMYRDVHARLQLLETP